MENPKDNNGVNIRKVITMISILIAFTLTGTYAFLNFIVSKNTEIEIPIVPIIENTGDLILLSRVNETIAHTASKTKNVMLLNISKCTKDINSEIYVLPIPQAVKAVEKVFFLFVVL